MSLLEKQIIEVGPANTVCQWSGVCGVCMWGVGCRVGCVYGVCGGVYVGCVCLGGRGSIPVAVLA